MSIKFICSDYTTLAIVQGLRNRKFIGKSDDEWNETLDALRIINEYQQAPNNFEVLEHAPICIPSRGFKDYEIVAACECWLEQVNTEKPMPFAFITIYETVRKMQLEYINKNLKKGTWEEKKMFGKSFYYMRDESGESVKVIDRKTWNLAA